MSEVNRFTVTTASLAMVLAQIVPLSVPIGVSATAAQQYGSKSQIVNCSSSVNSQWRCDLPANTQSVTFLGPDRSGWCQEGRTWWREGDTLVVTNGCGGRFEALYQTGNWGGGYPPGGNNGNWNQGFSGEVECATWNNSRRRCNVPTSNRVELTQVLGGECVQGRDWTYRNNRIEVWNGCRGRFAYGYGDFRPTGWGNNGNPGYPGGYQPPRDNGGPSAGAVIGGAALAAGLIALLASSGKKSSNNQTAGTARLTADLGKFPSDARTEGQACMNEAARQIGATGGSHVTLERVDRAERTASGWTLIAKVAGTYDGKAQTMTMDCRAKGATVTAFEVR